MLDPLGLRLSKRVRALLIAGLALLCAGGLASIGLGPGVPPGLGILALLHTLLTSGLVALVYAGAGVGYGAVLTRRLLGTGPHRWWLALAVGPAFLMWLSHALGTLGLLAGDLGRIVALGTCALGLILLSLEVLSAVRTRPNLPLPPQSAMLWCGGVGLLLVAACNPPGWLWASEGRGYDALSYHLQLPQEWLRLGRITPLEHNVYAYLPGAMESAFLHIAALLGPWRQWAAGAPGGAGLAGAARPQGLIAADGLGAIACQLLHAGLAVITAALIARSVWEIVRRADTSTASPRGAECGALAGAAVVSIPWVVVAGSMAYNDLAACALTAGALLAALRSDASPWRTGLACGLLVGMATACKPTALFFAAPIIGLTLLVELGGPRLVVRACVCAVACVLAGLVAIGPFLLRNTLRGGNPVFPAATDRFGSAHWSAEQVERFNTHHHQSASLADGLGLLLSRAGDALGASGAQPRGIFHEQWGGVRVANALIALDAPAAFFPVAVVCGLLALTWPARRVVLATGLGSAIGLAWWVLASHCQSRFLLPLIVPMGLFIGLGAARLAALRGPMPLELLRRLGLLGLGLLPLWLAASGVLLFLRDGPTADHGPLPNAMLADGTGLRTGASAAALLRHTADESEVAAIINQLGPEGYVNLCLPPRSGVLLLGDATPLYYTRPVVYATTWDDHPLAHAMREHPDDQAAWTLALHARAIDFIVVNFSELARLGRSGYLDPALTPARVEAFLERACVPVRRWESSGQALFRLRDAAAREQLPPPGGAKPAGPSARSIPAAPTQGGRS